MKPSNPKPKFQFSMKTLMLGITLAAMLSAIVGWIGALKSMTVLLMVIQIGGVTTFFTWKTLVILREIYATHVCQQIVASVLFAAMLYFISAFAFFLYLEVFHLDFLEGRFGNQSIDEAPRGWLFATILCTTISFLLLAALFIPLFIVASLFEFLAQRLNRLNTKSGYFGSSFIGLLVGSSVIAFAIPLGSFNSSEIILYILLPISIGIFVPPSILAWANKLGPKKRKHQAKPQLKAQAEPPISEAKSIQ